MKFFLSSYRLGNEPAKLAAMVAGGRRVLVIVNTWDLSNDLERRKAGIALKIFRRGLLFLRG